MKPQDILFFLVLIVVIVLKKPKLSVSMGLVCLLLAIPLFYLQIFFTAQHLTWYAAAFFLVAVITLSINTRSKNK